MNELPIIIVRPDLQERVMLLAAEPVLYFLAADVIYIYRTARDVFSIVAKRSRHRCQPASQPAPPPPTPRNYYTGNRTRARSPTFSADRVMIRNGENDLKTNLAIDHKRARARSQRLQNSCPYIYNDYNIILVRLPRARSENDASSKFNRNRIIENHIIIICIFSTAAAPARSRLLYNIRTRVYYIYVRWNSITRGRWCTVNRILKLIHRSRGRDHFACHRFIIHV